MLGSFSKHAFGAFFDEIVLATLTGFETASRIS
jgi:hypothetical protein